jgi:RimJ/RimL family protein N-acetyltransferase
MLVKLEPTRKERYWKILANGKEAGTVIIDKKEGHYASLTLWLYKQYQFTGVGPYALWLACEASGEQEVVCHVLRGNRPSHRACVKAGFIPDEVTKLGTLYLWKKGDHPEGFKEALAEKAGPAPTGESCSGTVN